ncbi:nucleophosmin-like [Ceratitis capitata]|uniref:nucleophosmin-like n=1 Tax=Ceratitis capitata TaxID=7213 RepID=UPI00032A1497|nr:nucleophosmin-like [Ceratitis capitata]
MSLKIAYYFAALLALLCLLQQLESTSAANTPHIQRVLTREELAARRQLRHQKQPQLNNKYNNQNSGHAEEDDDDDDDNDEDESEDENQALRDENTENTAAQAQTESNTGGAAAELPNTYKKGVYSESRARRRRGRRGGRPRGPRVVRKSRRPQFG